MTRNHFLLHITARHIVTAIVITIVVAAKAFDVKARFITMQDGLNNNTVRAIMQDSRGFIWMASHNGLSRYDGARFVNIIPDNKANITLADSKVNGIKEDNYGHLWITSAPFLVSCYDLESEQFVDFTGCNEYKTHYRYVEFIDGNTWLWGDDGCRIVTFTNGTFTSENLNRKGGIEESEVMRVEKTAHGIMISTNKVIYLWNNGTIKKIANNRNVMWQKAIGKVTMIAERDGTIWKYDKTMTKLGRIDGIKFSYDIPGQITIGDKWILFTSHGGYVVDTHSGKIYRAKGELDIANAMAATDNNGDYWVYNRTGIVKYVEKKTGRIRTFKLMDSETLRNIDSERYNIIDDSHGKLWITTYGCGLYVYDKAQDHLYHFTADKTKATLLETNSLLAITQDKAGNIWLGTWLAGASLLHPTDTKAYTTLADSHANLTTGTIRMIDHMGDEIWIADTKGNTIKTTNRLDNPQTVDCDGVSIYATCRDSMGTLWLGSRQYGLKIGNAWYKKDNSNTTSLGHNAVFDILCDKRGRMWVGTFGGGLCLATKGSDGKYTFKRFFNNDFGTKRIRIICADKRGWLWVGTSGGLLVFDPDKLVSNPKAYDIYNQENGKLRNNEVRSIMQDSKGRMWIAETGDGFAITDPKGDYADLNFEHYSPTDGLVNGMVQAFVEDAKGRIWISTEYGISCFTPKTKNFCNYFFASSMAGNNYSENCATRLYDGRIALGTNEGLAIINPNQIAESGEAAKVTFTELRINGTRLPQGNSNYSNGKALPYANEITLEHNQNSIEIYFSTLNFAITAQTQYSYKLEGYDRDWSQPSSIDFAAYKNLAPGTYTLHVRATNADGEWSDQESTMTITIEPPFWASPWAYILYLFLIAALAYLAFKTFRKMDALRTQVKVEEQMAEYKLVFFTNISHEFRTPLTLIGASLDRLQRSINNEGERKSALAMMDKSMARMKRLIDELLEFHKAEKGKLTLALEPTEIVGQLRDFYEAFADSAVAKQMTYLYEPALQSLVIPIDRDKLDKIVNNLLSNAFKYTNTGGTIILKVSIDDQKLTISVSDTGIGIPPDKRAILFERFAVGNVKRGSMGIGLHLVHSLVVAHKGTISYDENPGGGSIFTVKLPADESVYTETDYLKPSLQSASEESKASRQTELTKEEDKPENTVEVTTPLNDRTVLVIEDDNDVRQLLVDELAPYVNVVARPDGTSGYNFARENDIDLIICDVMMPGMDGFEVTSRLKGDFDTSHIPVILLTALSAEESKIKGAKCGADNYVTKPFNTQLLLTTVIKTIEQREKLKEKFSRDVTAVRPLISANDKDKVFADKLSDVINKNLSNPDFTIDNFADEMALGRTILFRKIKGVTGYTPKEYLRVMRMKKAAELLLQPDINVSEAAYSVGLSDPFYFSKCFKQQFGVPPSEYKNKKLSTSPPKLL